MELKYNIVVPMPKITREGYYTCTVHVEYEWKPPRCSCWFKPHKEYRPVPKNPTVILSGNKKNCVAHTNEVTNYNPFDAFNSVDNDTCNTLIIDKIKKFEDLLINGKVILVDEAGNPLKKVECLGDYDSVDEVASIDNDMARSLALERDLPQEIQAICDNLDIRVRRRKKK
nr:hypothetical protein [Tanacetum cinerariifolium]